MHSSAERSYLETNSFLNFTKVYSAWEHEYWGGWEQHCSSWQAEVRLKRPEPATTSCAEQPFSHGSLIMTTDSWLTYKKADIILLHLIQTNLQEHLNWSDATEGHGLHLAMVRLLDQFTEQTATPLMNLKMKQVFLWGNCVQNTVVLFRNTLW